MYEWAVGWKQRLTCRVTRRISSFRRAIFEPLVWVRIPEWAAGNCNSSAVEYGKQLLVVMSTQYAWNVD